MIKLQVHIVPPSAAKANKPLAYNGTGNNVDMSVMQMQSQIYPGSQSQPNNSYYPNFTLNGSSTPLVNGISSFNSQRPSYGPSPHIVGTSDGIKKFLHITKSSSTLQDVCVEIQERFLRLYPEQEPIIIHQIQDSNECDLDPEYSVSMIFDTDNILRVLVENEFTGEEETDSRGKRHLHNDLNQIVKKTRSSRNQRVWHEARQPPLLEADEASHQSNLSLPAPNDGHQDATVIIEPKKNLSPRNASPVNAPGSPTRITSGMLTSQFQPDLSKALDENEKDEERDLQINDVLTDSDHYQSDSNQDTSAVRKRPSVPTKADVMNRISSVQRKSPVQLNDTSNSSFSSIPAQTPTPANVVSNPSFKETKPMKPSQVTKKLNDSVKGPDADFGKKTQQKDTNKESTTPKARGKKQKETKEQNEQKNGSKEDANQHPPAEETPVAKPRRGRPVGSKNRVKKAEAKEDESQNGEETAKPEEKKKPARKSKAKKVEAAAAESSETKDTNTNKTAATEPTSQNAESKTAADTRENDSAKNHSSDAQKPGTNYTRAEVIGLLKDGMKGKTKSNDAPAHQVQSNGIAEKAGKPPVASNSQPLVSQPAESESDSSDDDNDDNDDDELEDEQETMKRPRVVNAPKGLLSNTSVLSSRNNSTLNESQISSPPPSTQEGRVVPQLLSQSQTQPPHASQSESSISSLPKLSQLMERGLPDVREFSQGVRAISAFRQEKSESDSETESSDSEDDSDDSQDDSSDSETVGSQRYLDAKMASNIVSKAKGKKKNHGFLDLMKDARK
ncbi:hypothetical protein KL918_000809 [Ogataea parapolymorpha]|uniref:Nucleolar protein Dnt1-like N-terminal domain-containing protein n=1 Tax=Ogataea parapolymorpha (strain ATCC 26012 / BCRC 20466 / JCM 22074 / NRRL Y-7560 / DL-1) TaxID=871575 RepID=W1Q8Q0_OGAPD|nr:hypothetical protein HPODL_01304 [Ogataea parapolymorpha DL-1]ESW97200.1 hypothetical protein HPODL_01304 [Ogataea parapolymorpha DL-1]KAG7869264.1 hypothetical protein KL918_000809 [Ogataea parapolymorpha]KAG7875684.1 hypothetical protein KL916_000355 [Ogataea parapolymorpha]